jgi:prepilin-type N-terminal cleavage/methylation domain-containing protein
MSMTYQQRVNKNRLRGFSLLEMSIVLIIVATLTGLGIQSGANMMESARVSQTQKKIEQIKRALYVFRVSNNRIPCPASLTLPVSSVNFGVQGPSTANCMDATAGAATATILSSDFSVAEGAVPTKALSLPDEFAFDGWGNRIRYSVSLIYTEIDSFSSSTLDDNCGAIKVLDGTGASNFRTDAAVFALVSSGPNGHGAYTRSGAVKSAGSTNADEQRNCNCNSSAAATTFGSTYTQRAFYQNPASSTDAYDDIVDYQMRWQMPSSADNNLLVNNGTSLTTVPSKYMAVADYLQANLTVYKMLAGDVFTPLATPAVVCCAQSMTFSTDSKFLLEWSFAVKLYKKSAADVFVLSATSPLATARGAAMSPSGRYIVTGSFASNRLDLYKNCNGRLTALPITPAPGVSHYGTYTFTDDEKYLAVSGRSPGNLAVYKKGTGIEPYTIIQDFVGGADIGSVSFAPQGTYLAFATWSGVKVFKRTGDVFSDAGVTFNIAPMTSAKGAIFSPDGNKLVIYGPFTTVNLGAPYLQIYSRAGDSFTKDADPIGTAMPTVVGTSGSVVTSAAFSGDSTYLFVGLDADDPRRYLIYKKQANGSYSYLPPSLTFPAWSMMGVAFGG